MRQSEECEFRGSAESLFLKKFEKCRMVQCADVDFSGTEECKVEVEVFKSAVRKYKNWQEKSLIECNIYFLRFFCLLFK